MVTEETVLGEELLWGIDSVWGECGGCVWAGVGDGGVGRTLQGPPAEGHEAEEFVDRVWGGGERGYI